MTLLTLRQELSLCAILLGYVAVFWLNRRGRTSRVDAMGEE